MDRVPALRAYPKLSDWNSIIFIRDILDGWRVPAFDHDRGRIIGPKWEDALSQVSQRLPKSNAFHFDYVLPQSATIRTACSYESIRDFAYMVTDFLERQQGTQRLSMRLFLVGHGYGGLVCEQVSEAIQFVQRVSLPRFRRHT